MTAVILGNLFAVICKGVVGSMLKELEKLGPKKGVISQSVKDVIQSLVDDDLVLKDKIGSSIYFWSLPSTAGNQDEREEALNELQSVELKHNELKAELAQYADNDPAALEAMKKAIQVAYSAANRWTGYTLGHQPSNADPLSVSFLKQFPDNIFTFRQWCANNFPQAKDQLEHMYQEM
ncbi:hypothetical protein Cgig2_021961 [Carnegiea gigantea]|uniref:Meiotic nuclear division protein 1 homolog n=1 Tax=Carnegiea gigantea TaxID=171969 RepID=A0A9Q1QMN4_9CARY|nr:hypothetical protein Cgig2_021961 [Carnegiea gigantea]